MPREKLDLAAAMGIVVVLTVSIGMVGAWAALRTAHPATHLAGGVLRASPSPSPTAAPSASPSPPAPVLPHTAQVVAPSAKVVWALMDYDVLFVSTDQGNTWEKRSLPTPSSGIRPLISFINEREGWLLAPGVPATQCQEATADIWHTSDGATTWQHLNVFGIDKSQCKDGIWFIDAKHGFVSASDPNHHPTIYRTIDGGITWTSAVLPDPPDFKSSAGGFELAAHWLKAFGPTLYLEAANDQSDPAASRQYIFTSSDGRSWSWRQKVPPWIPVMVTETRLLLLTGPGDPQESTNGGQQWHPYTTDLSLDSHDFGGAAIVFADAQVGYETGNGLLQRTSDGGAHWVRVEVTGTAPAPGGIPMPTTAVLSAPSANVAWALVATSSLFRSTDQGKSWTQRPLPTPSGSTESPLVSFIDDKTGFVLYPHLPDEPSCGSQAAELWETIDGATTWHVVSTTAPFQTPPRGLPPTQCKDAMYFADARHGWLATGSNIGLPTIWRTVDGGMSWDSSAPNDPRLNLFNQPSARVSAIAAYGPTVLLYMAPYIFRSTDGGVSWVWVTSPPSFTASVGFVTASRWIELIQPSQSSETTNAGASWHTLNTDYSQAAPVAPQIVFADANVGYATVRGEIQRTLDGGAHWEMIKTSWP